MLHKGKPGFKCVVLQVGGKVLFFYKAALDNLRHFTFSDR